jgi:hypothetical protein
MTALIPKAAKLAGCLNGRKVPRGDIYVIQSHRWVLLALASQGTSRALAGSRARTDVMTDDLSDLEIAVLCDLLENPDANLKAHKRAVLDQLVAKKLVEPAKHEPTKFQLSDEARHVLAVRGVGVSGG